MALRFTGMIFFFKHEVIPFPFAQTEIQERAFGSKLQYVRGIIAETELTEDPDTRSSPFSKHVSGLDSGAIYQLLKAKGSAGRCKGLVRLVQLGSTARADVHVAPHAATDSVQNRPTSETCAPGHHLRSLQ
jgi:hypothetical protein